MRDRHISAEAMLALAWFVSTLVFVLVVLRLVVHRRVGLNTPAIIASDALVSLSWICGTLAVAIDTWHESRMIQSRTRTLTSEENLISRIVMFACGYFVFSATWLAKGAFVVYSYHLFPGLSPRLRKHLYFVTGFTAATYLVTILMQSLWCLPLQRIWSGHCNPTGNGTILPIWCLLDISTDMLILVIPLSVFWAPFPRVWKHQLLGFCLVFFIGSLSIFAAVGRFVMLFPMVLRNPNARIMRAYQLWALAEITASQMTVCLPALRVVLRAHQKRKEQQNRNRPAGSAAAVGERKVEEVSSLQELRVRGGSLEEWSLQELQVHGSHHEQYSSQK